MRPAESLSNLDKARHTRWHKTKPKAECQYCFPPSEPVAQSELLQEVVQVLEALPEPQPEIPLVPIAVEPEEPTTAIAHAFRKLFK